MSAFVNLFGWDKVSWIKKVLIAIPLVAAFAAWQYYTKPKC